MDKKEDERQSISLIKEVRCLTQKSLEDYKKFLPAQYTKDHRNCDRYTAYQNWESLNRTILSDEEKKVTKPKKLLIKQ